MYGTKARIGLLTPSANTIIEEEFHALKPDGVSVHSARMFVTSPTKEGLVRMVEDTEMATEMIATLEPSIIAFGCTTGSLLGGIGWDETLVTRIEKIAKVPATTTATAVVRALKKLGISKIAVGTPYGKELNELEAGFFQNSGIKVVAMKGLDLTREEMHQLPLEEVMELAHEVDRPNAEAVFLSCTNLKAVPVVAQLEKDLEKYVFSSNIATFWDVMRILAFQQPIKGSGKLLETI